MTDEEKRKAVVTKAYTMIRIVENIFDNYCEEFYNCDGCPFLETGDCIRGEVKDASYSMKELYYAEVAR